VEDVFGVAFGSHGYDIAFTDGRGGVVDEEVVVDCVVLGGGCVSAIPGGA